MFYDASGHVRALLAAWTSMVLPDLKPGPCRRSSSSGSTTPLVYAFGLEEHQHSEASVNAGNTYFSALAED